MEDTIELREIFAVLRKRWIIIFLITSVASLTSAVASFFLITPIYEASTQLLVNKSDRDNGLYNFNDINTDLKLVETYNVIINSPRIIELVIKELNLSLTPQQLSGKVKVNSVKNSQVISITVSDENQAEAARIANGIATVFQREITSIMKVDNVQVLSVAKADPVPVPVKPKPALNIAIAFVVGLMTGIGIVFLLEYLDQSIRDEQEVEQLLGLAVLGSIPKIETAGRNKAKHAKASSVFSGNVERKAGESL